MYRRLKAYTNIDLGIRTLMSIESTLSDGVASRNHPRHWAYALKRSRLLPSAGLSGSLPTAQLAISLASVSDHFIPSNLCTRPILYCNYEAHNFHRYLLLDFCSCIIDSMVQSGSP